MALLLTYRGTRYALGLESGLKNRFICLCFVELLTDRSMISPNTTISFDRASFAHAEIYRNRANAQNRILKIFFFLIKIIESLLSVYVNVMFARYLPARNRGGLLTYCPPYVGLHFGFLCIFIYLLFFF